MIELPPFQATQGQAAEYQFQWTGNDLTGHIGVVTLKKSPGGVEIGTGSCTLDASGNVEFAFTAAETALFPAREKVGFFVVGVFQVAITGPTSNETFQGPLKVAVEL